MSRPPVAKTARHGASLARPGLARRRTAATLAIWVGVTMGLSLTSGSRVLGDAAAPAETGSAPTSDGASLEVVVTGFPSDEGSALVSLIRGQQAYEDDGEPAEEAQLEIHARSARWRIPGLAPGQYAIRVFHDANDNGKLDTNWLRAPKEHFGFSNNPPPRMGPARWKDAHFEVGSEPRRLEIVLLPPPF